MRALLQRVTSASVAIDGKITAEIGQGLMILFGVGQGDTEEDVAYVADRCVKLRIFEDEAGKMNLSLLDVGGEALIVSQFTLYADTVHGRRPGFTDAAEPEHANALYELFVQTVRNFGVKTGTGVFGADMHVTIHNDGPVTMMVESKPKAKNTK